MENFAPALQVEYTTPCHKKFINARPLAVFFFPRLYFFPPRSLIYTFASFVIFIYLSAFVFSVLLWTCLSFSLPICHTLPLHLKPFICLSLSAPVIPFSSLPIPAFAEPHLFHHLLLGPKSYEITVSLKPHEFVTSGLKARCQGTCCGTVFGTASAVSAPQALPSPHLFVMTLAPYSTHPTLSTCTLPPPSPARPSLAPSLQLWLCDTRQNPDNVSECVGSVMKEARRWGCTMCTILSVRQHDV